MTTYKKSRSTDDVKRKDETFFLPKKGKTRKFNLEDRE